MKFFVKLGACSVLALVAQIAQAQGGAPHIVEAFALAPLSLSDVDDLLWIASEGSIAPSALDDSAPGTGILY
ncbi:hypothetical protein [Piscinibacter terrae]|uniref:hypothetical protein n=1 Tax=Piscinibacter terrae TaxID=2496871 RepID=UPI000F590B86|nr:hypothetical protein [Albitalea terrae]